MLLPLAPWILVVLPSAALQPRTSALVARARAQAAQVAPGQVAAVPGAATPSATGQQTPAVAEPRRPGRKADETSGKKPAYELDTLVVTPGRKSERVLDTPFTTEAISAETIERRGYRSTPQALRNVPGVSVQETAPGHGSPYIRGFTSFRTLMLIDGIRLNNSVFRSGPNQYWNTVDPLSLERLEVVKGPASVLYGSDAIGGTVNAITKSPYAWGRPSGFAGEALWRVNSAEHSHVARVELSGTVGPDSGYLIGANRKDFGDVEAGSPTGEQPNTGYSEWDGDVKVESFLSDATRLVVAHQQVDQNDVPRTHKTIFAKSFEGTTIGSDLARDYDQERSLSYVQLHLDELAGGLDRATLSLSWQRQEELLRRTRSSGAREDQGFEVGTLGLFASAESETASGDWVFGFEFYRDHVDSFLDKFGNQSAADNIQGPVADDASYDLLGVYAQDEFPLSDQLTLMAGARFNYAAVDANEVLDPETDAQTSIDQDWSALAGSLRFRYELEPDRWSLFGGVSQGFRAPNLSDLTRLDDARSNEFEIPSTKLDPERYLSYELGVKVQEQGLSAELSAYYTQIRDQIQRFPTGDTNADGDILITKDNIGDGEVHGLELGAAWTFDPDWTLFGNGTFTEGEVDTYPTSASQIERETISRQMPLTLQLGLRWQEPLQRGWAELLVLHAEDADQLSTSDERDTERIPPGGTPGYTVLDLTAGWQATRDIELTAGVLNVTDEDYRVHGSGSNRPGQALMFGVRASF